MKNYQHRTASSSFLAPLPGTEEEEEAPTSTTRSHVNYAPALHQRRKKLRQERDIIMRNPDYNSTPSKGYWSEYTNSSESSMERHKDPKHSRKTTARVAEESYTRSPSANQPEEEEEFVQETPEAALIAAQAYLLTT
jgi:hypothetical protein